METGQGQDARDALTAYFEEVGGKTARYYQQAAINRTVAAVLNGQARILITMATGTGKTFVAFQIVWRLWKAGRKKRILYLADRNILIDQAKDLTFSPMGEALHKIKGRAVKSREVYFALYQALDNPGTGVQLYKQYLKDFFDLIIVDECHRGSAREESSWRGILEYFEPAQQIGMTATPKRDDNVDTYEYFGDPIYTYSLKQGIEDGFLAPYRVYRVIPDVDAQGLQINAGVLDRFGREIPAGLYGTKEFERLVSLLTRTEAVAKHLTDMMKRTGRYDKTIIFCVDQEHALDMRKAIKNLNADLVKIHPNYVQRVVSDEGKFGCSHLDDFQDPETETPVILTTSQMLTTGENVRRLNLSAEHLQKIWPLPEQRAEILELLRTRGIDPEHLAQVTHHPEADALDLLLHVAYNAPLVSRSERAEKLRQKKQNFFNTFTPAAREILNLLLDKYADFRIGEWEDLKSVLNVPPFSEIGAPLEITQRFGGPHEMREAVGQMQRLLYEGGER